jgi:fatty acid desaturase
MEETFDDQLSPDDLRGLYEGRDAPGLVRFVVQVVFAAVSGALLVLATAPWEWALALGAHAVAQVSFFGTLHESAHRTAFRTRSLNELAGWVAALCQLMCPQLMRAFHFEHHRHTHDVEKDPELAGLELMARWPSGLWWIVNASGVPIQFARIGMTLTCALGAPGPLRRLAVPYLRPKDRRGVCLGSLLLVGIHVALVAAALRWDPRALRIYLAVPLAHVLLSLYVACEHRGLPTEGSVVERTRSFAAGPLIRWLFWNMPYHAEHHAYPAVPFHALGRLHAALAPTLPHRTGGPLALHLRGGRAPARP